MLKSQMTNKSKHIRIWLKTAVLSYVKDLRIRKAKNEFKLIQ